MKLSNFGITDSIIRLACALLCVHSSHALAQQNIFSGLEYDEMQIRGAIERHSARIEAKAGSAEIPSSVSYRIFIQELLEDSNSDLPIPEPDRRVLQDLAVMATQELADQHRTVLIGLCDRAAHDVGSAAETVELATLFDESHSQSERELDIRFAEALDRLGPATAQNVQTRWKDFSERRTVVYTSFDMAGFSREMPAAAHRILLDGCTRFRNMTSNR